MGRLFLVLDLNHRAGGEEEAGHLDGIIEKTSTVVSQVQDDPCNPQAPQLLYLFGDIVRGAPAVVLVLDVMVKLGKFNVPIGLPGTLLLDERGAGVGLLNLDDIPDQGDHLDPSVRLSNRQTNPGALFPPYILNRFGDVDPHQIHWILVPLGNLQNQIPRLDLPLPPDGTAGNHLGHSDVAVLLAQKGADTLQGSAHLDLKLILLIRCEVRCMGIEDRGHGVQEMGVHVVLTGLQQPVKKAVDPLFHGLSRLLLLDGVEEVRGRPLLLSDQV